MYKIDSNVLVASWINDLGYKQNEEDSKELFYNSESLLNKGDLLEHFKKDNRKKFADKNIQFMCKKGIRHDYNQDNFFVIVEKKIKFIGIFDGHGVNGHQMSSFAMSSMVDFIQNSKRFNDIDVDEISDDKMTKAMRKCFRYVQDMAKEKFRDFLINKKRNKRREDIKMYNKMNNTDKEEQEEDERHLDDVSVSIDSDEREFIDNISWDTDSDDEDFELDNLIIEDVEKNKVSDND